MKQGALVLAGAAGLLLLSCATLSPQARLHEDLALARQHAGAQQVSLAADEYGKALDLDPTNLEALRGYVQSCRAAGRLDEAKARFQHAVEKAPGDAYAHEGLGLVDYARGQSGESAKKQLGAAARLAPKIADFHYRLGVLLVDQDDWENAKAELEQAVGLDANQPRYRLPFAVALARSGEEEAAIAQLTTVLSLNPTPAEVAMAAKTARMLTDPFRGFPHAAREQFRQALDWLDSGSPKQAEAVLEKLAQEYPDLAIVRATLGLTAAKMDEPGQAIVEFQRAIDLGPELAEPRIYLGDVYFSHGRPQKAIPYYRAALARNPFLPDAYLRLAQAHLKDGEKAQAAQRFETYLLLRPGNLDASLEYATILGDLGSPKAGATWDHLVQVFPREPMVLIGRGRWYSGAAILAKTHEARLAAWNKAKESLDKALDLDPRNETAAGMLSALEKQHP